MRAHVSLTLFILASASVAAQHTFRHDPKIPIDREYTAKIKEYTTQPFSSSALVG